MEVSGERLILLFLDWEKAFDEIDHEELIKAVGRFNLPEKIIRVIRSFYENPNFFIEDNFSSSEPKKQETGIRQGCPLSPYLFVMVMTVIMHNVHYDLEKGSLQKGFYDEYSFIDFWELLYTDDTLIIGKTNEKV